MTIPPAPTFEPGMLPEARRPFYESFTGKTGDVAANFARTKPTGTVMGDIMNRINKIDKDVGQNLMMNDPESLNVVIGEQNSFSMYHGDIGDYKNDPITLDLIKGEPIKTDKDLIIFESTIQGLFIKITGKWSGGNTGFQVTSSLIGSNDELLKKKS